MMEQYILPKTPVSRMRKHIPAAFSASNAGRNCILASHPNHLWRVPVKSRNRPVMRMKTIKARIILVLRNIRYVLVVAKVDNIFPNRLTEVTEIITLFTYLC